MSLSSLLVVLNAMRLLRVPGVRPEATAAAPLTAAGLRV
jgi:hypothetical protein